jgi:flagellar basal body-associated protein FliL
MEQENAIKTIFENQLSYLSLDYIKSASKWAMFMGVVITILAVLMLIPAGLSWTYAHKFSEIFEQVAEQNPQAAIFQKMGGQIFMIFLLIVSVMLLIQGIFYIRFAQAGKKYINSNTEEESIQCFENLSHIFLVSFIFSIFSIVGTIAGVIFIAK